MVSTNRQDLLAEEKAQEGESKKPDVSSATASE